MGIGGRAWRKLVMGFAVPGVAIGTLAGFGAAPAMAGVTTSHAPSPHEWFHGFEAGANGVIPIWTSGVVGDHGIIDLTGPNPGDIIHLSHGSINVGHDNNKTSYEILPKSCNVTYSDSSDYAIEGGTGLYSDAFGEGTAHIYVTAVLRRDHDGTCDTSEPIPGTIFTYFDAYGPFSLDGP